MDEKFRVDDRHLQSKWERYIKDLIRRYGPDAKAHDVWKHESMERQGRAEIAEKLRSEFHIVRETRE